MQDKRNLPQFISTKHDSWLAHCWSGIIISNKLSEESEMVNEHKSPPQKKKDRTLQNPKAHILSLENWHVVTNQLLQSWIFQPANLQLKISNKYMYTSIIPRVLRAKQLKLPNPQSLLPFKDKVSVQTQS